MRKTEKKRIMVFGTFDMLHQGHINFFKQARRLAKKPYLIVSVAQTSNVKKIKGKKPFFSQNQRMRFVEQTGLADKVVLGAKVRFLSHILTEQPDIIALGYDQTAYTKDLGHRLADAGLAVKICRLKAFKPGKYKSSLLKQQRKLATLPK